jgi:hypothetical protein
MRGGGGTDDGDCLALAGAALDALLIAAGATVHCMGWVYARTALQARQTTDELAEVLDQ